MRNIQMIIIVINKCYRFNRQHQIHDSGSCIKADFVQFKFLKVVFWSTVRFKFIFQKVFEVIIATEYMYDIDCCIEYICLLLHKLAQFTT